MERERGSASSAEAIFALIVFDQSRPFAVRPHPLWSSCRGRCKATPTCVWKSSGVCLMLPFVIQLVLKRSNCLWAKLSLLPIYLTGSAESFNECCQATVETGPVKALAKKTQRGLFFLPLNLIFMCHLRALTMPMLSTSESVSCLEKQNDFFFFLNRSSKIQKTFNTTTCLMVTVAAVTNDQCVCLPDKYSAKESFQAVLAGFTYLQLTSAPTSN